MFDRFSTHARKAMSCCWQEALHAGSPEIEPEHILLGLLNAHPGTTHLLLTNMGVPINELRLAMQVRITREGATPIAARELPFSTLGKRVLDLALSESVSSQCGYVGTQHLLLGLISEDGSFAAQTLIKIGGTLTAVREECAELLAAKPIECAEPVIPMSVFHPASSPKPKPRVQIHLSTALVLTVAASAMLWPIVRLCKPVIVDTFAGECSPLSALAVTILFGAPYLWVLFHIGRICESRIRRRNTIPTYYSRL